MRLIKLAFLAILAVSAPLHAQGELPRPSLPVRADENDWEAYLDYGVRIFREQPATAEAMFYWASRLDPSRSEPLFGRWAAFFARDLTRYERYLEKDRRVLARPDVQAADSLRELAYLRNPFVSPGLEVLLMDQLPGRWRGDLATQGWLAHAQGQHARATQLFGRLVRANPERNYHYRYDRSVAFVALAQYDSAATELEALVAASRQRDEERLSYQSKEMYEYALGMLHMARGDVPAASAAMERALLENAGLYAARARLGELRLMQRRPAEALEEFRQAVEIAPEDGYLRYQYGTALSALRRHAEAAEQLRLAVHLEPHYAEGYAALAAALEGAGQRAEALAAWRRYVALAPRSAAAAVGRARQRIAALEQAPAAPE